ncbi:MAG TPA: ComEA family DNA-binding protein [Dehalococcoidia bacterium]|nr:ComEA family DNA-binding protein [Dehalococcoidia bacterium]
MPDLLERYRWLIVAVFAVPLLMGIGFLLEDRFSGPEPLEIDLGEVPAEEISVYVTGAVQRPGVYPMDDGDRWIDALEDAGGATEDADLAAVDLARRARDEDTIVVPRLGQTAAAGASLGPLVNINTADAKMLEALPGIGEVRAGRIVQSRDEDGAFGSVDDLLERELVPASVFEEIADLVTVGP